MTPNHEALASLPLKGTRPVAGGTPATGALAWPAPRPFDSGVPVRSAWGDRPHLAR